MDLTCGILIVNEHNELFMAHSTGNTFFDIPKGLKDEGETPMEAALRECSEECGLNLQANQLIDLGEFKYNPKKNLHIFLAKVNKDSIAMDSLVCNSFFEHQYTKKQTPEVDSWKWVVLSDENLKENCAKSMYKVLKNYFGF